MVKIIKDVQSNGIKSAYVECPFDEGKKYLKRGGYQIPSLAQNARLRIQEGRESRVSQNGNWVKEGILYIKNKGKYLTLDSPIMDNPSKATRARRIEEEYYLNEEQIEKALIHAIKLPDENFSIPTDRFWEDSFTNFIFEDIAEDYGYFLKQDKIDEMSVWMAYENLDKSFARQIWFMCLGYGTGIKDDKVLYFDNQVLGVYE